MTHFVGFAVAPKGADLDALLAPFDENRETPRFLRATRAQLIEEARSEIAKSTGPGSNFEDFWRDPAAYLQAHCISDHGLLRNSAHVNYLAKELPAQLRFDDEQLYAYAIRFESDLDADGAAWSDCNPDSIWDWWVVGGRWDGAYAPDNRISVAAYLGRLADDPDDIPPRVLFDGAGVLRRGTEGWFGFTDDNVEDRAWRTQVIERLNEHADDDVLTFLDLHI